MSYWSLRRTAERAAAGHELARSTDETLTAASRPAAIKLPDWTPVAGDLHPATVTSPTRTLRQRAAELDKALWTVPAQTPADLDPTYPNGVRVRVRSSW